MEVRRKLYDLQALNFLHGSHLKVALLGGSFNPAHYGHVAISLEALKYYGFDYVIWVVAKQNPLKAPYGPTLEQRSNYALAIADHPRILVSNLEKDLKTNYAYDTLKFLHERFVSVDFTWLAGIDIIAGFHKWHKYREFAKLGKMIIFDRPCALRKINYGRFASKFKPIVAKNQTADIIVHRGGSYAVSSSQIRDLSGE